MEQITTSGPSYRTKCLTLEAASRFARCVAANSTRFVVVGIEESRKAKGERRYFVRFAPVNPERLGEIIDRQQARRDERAAREGDGYLWDHQNGWSYCCSLSGETYETTERRCSCPDATYRMNPSGAVCKHSLALIRLNGDPAEEYRDYYPGEDTDRVDFLREAAEEAERAMRAEWGSANADPRCWR